jgi:hypothetical protein
MSSICHFKFLLNDGFHKGKKFWVTTSEYKFTNKKNKYYEMVTYFVGIDIEVKMASIIVCVKNKATHFSIPSLRSLLKVIERYLKAINKFRCILTICTSGIKEYICAQVMQTPPFSLGLRDLPIKDLQFSELN